jgi:hypothetical protein
MQVGWQDHLSKGDDCEIHIASLVFEPEQTVRNRFEVPVWLEEDAWPDHAKGILGKRR